MARKQRRRSISIRPKIYGRLRALSRKRGESGSSIVEFLISQACNDAGIPVEVPTPAPSGRRRKPAPEETEALRAACFTF